MSRLADFEIASRKVTVPNPNGEPLELVVSGLSFDEIVGLVSAYGDELQAVYQEASTGETDVADVASLFWSMFNKAPEVVALIIALGINELDQVEKVGRLPLSVQLELLEAVGELTFISEGGPGKVLEIVTRMVQGMTNPDFRND
jgi:hypothetical protein